MLTTKIKLTDKQEQAINVLDNKVHDKVLLLGGSGSGKSFLAAYKIIKDTLIYKAPCLIVRDKLVDLSQGMIDQIIPSVLQLIAKENGVERWDTWLIDGLKFAKWTEKKTKLEFCTGGYVRLGGYSSRDLSESGSDKILSPSWLHILVEEASESPWETVELLMTRLRFQDSNVLNKLILTENPPSINHWTYKRFYEKKREEGGDLSREELLNQYYVEMQPRDNRENLSDNYIKNLSQLSGANRERFYEGKFQDSESGEIFKKVDWINNMPRNCDWDKIVLYTDPTPLTGKEHSKWADYKASALVGLYDGHTFVIDVRMVKGSTLDMLNNMKQLWDISPDQSKTEVFMEKKQVPSDFKQVMQSFSVMTGWSCPLQWDTRNFGDKKAAIETFLQPLFEAETIHFNDSFRNTERGKQTQFQILKFSRKTNKNVHDDILDAIMKADTKLKGKNGRKRRDGTTPVSLIIQPLIQRTIV